MKKYEKEILQSQLNMEADELKKLKSIYMQASDDVKNKIRLMDGKINVLLKDFDELDDVQKSILQSKIYQKKFQESLNNQIEDVLKELNSKQYKNVNEYLKACYENGIAGAAQSLHKQGIPIILPIDKKEVYAASKLDSKVSKRLYGEYTQQLKKEIQGEISRGIATSSSYSEIARNIDSKANVGFNKAMRIARTEGGKIRNSAAYNAALEAKEKGADIVLQWDAALDKRTRDSHRRVDGEIVELGERFSNGLLFPCDPAGAAGEVINCRCAALQRARWALDEEELETQKKRAEYFKLDKTENFNTFQKKYLNAAEKVLEAPAIKVAVMASAVENFTSALEKSEGVENHVMKMRMHAEYVEYEENENLRVPFAYNATKDIIEYNHKAPHFGQYDMNFVQAHELTHRMDILEYDSNSHADFVAAIYQCRQRVMENADEIESWFAEGGKYENNAALSDIISALSKGQLHVSYGHPDTYWEKEENIIREIFANISAIDVLDSKTKKDVESILKELFESYEGIVK